MKRFIERKKKIKILKNISSKLISCAVAATMIFSSVSAFASILGEQTSHSETEYAQGTTYNRNTFQSESVGQQTENFFEYIPNEDVLPMISNGDKVFGKRTVLQANDYQNDMGIFAAMGMNADFFSFQTGVPMSNTVYDGHILTADQDFLYGIGFNNDGTGFVAPMQFYIGIDTPEGAHFDIECLNKYRQPYVMYMYTDEFANYTNASGSGTNVVLGNVSGDIILGQSITATVESIFVDDGSVEIPKGKMVISVDDKAAWEVRDRLSHLYEGQTITITANNLTGDARWESAQYGTGCLGGTLIIDGQLKYEDDSAAPRSAVGIKADGSMIFYTIDGRQSGYSYGARKETLAKRLLELGCVDAVNLDGGGSTQLAGTPPETTDFQILNSPSENLRSCANFIFLRKMNSPSGVPYKLLAYPYGEYVLSGSSIGVWVSAIDSSYGKATITEPVEYFIEADYTNTSAATITNDGYATIYGDGEVYIGANSGAAYGSTLIHSVTTPDRIIAKNEVDMSDVTALTLSPGESVFLTTESIYQNMVLTDTDEAYTWSLSRDDLGTILEDGTFIAGDSAVDGTIDIGAGTTSVSIPVHITRELMPTMTPAPRPDEREYPIITTSRSGNVFTAKFHDIHGDLDASNIVFLVDGEKTQFKVVNENTLEYTFPSDYINGAYVFTIVATDDSGYSTFKTYTVGDLSSVPNQFDDTKEHWARDHISYMCSRGVVSGYQEDAGTFFRPNQNMTRAEFACMIAKYLQVNVNSFESVELPYADVDKIPSWALPSVKAMYSLGIMKGQQDGDKVFFASSSNIRRSEFSVAAARLLPDGLYRAPIMASDENDVPLWAVDATELLLTQGIMGGYDDGTLKPNNNVTRAEAVKILYGIG